MEDIESVKRRFDIIGRSQKLNDALEKTLQVAPTDLTVLIIGESGVGKEIFSKVIHQGSKRKHNDFIAVNCGAIPEGTIDSELFGHVKGAFTGAHDSREGYFESVDKGTIFLDEISEMPRSTQARLLRVLESGEFIRVGSSEVKKTDVRVIAATNKNLLQLVQDGKFREDLYWRLNTVPIYIPPLRERKEDIHLLFRKFCADFAESYKFTPVRLDEEAQRILENYRWPGNVRQLKHVAEQVSVLSEKDTIEGEALYKYIPEAEESNLPILNKDSQQEGGSTQYSEREILYRILFELREDVNDLKKVMLDLLQNKASKEDLQKYKQDLIKDWSRELEEAPPSREGKDMSSLTKEGDSPVVISESDSDEPNQQDSTYNEAEVVDESLSIADKEQELIEKALKKHNGKRKEAAIDLGISERTLYRKIKEYGIES
jgi:transcriptional regulator with PAS, ATPase and Fis domain